MNRQPVRVLIVDDDRFVQRSIAEFIQAAGDLECAGTCGNGAEAVAFVAAHPVDVVLMDVQMPVMDGVEAARLIIESHPRVRVLMWTSFDNDTAVATALRHGAAGFLLKTCTARTLIDAIRTAHGGMTVLAPDTLRALQSVPSPAPDAPELTEREAEVLAALCRGLSNAEMASQLFLSESSIKAYLSSLMQKLDVHTRVKLVLKAHEYGMVRP
nr:response regulator transcription factor [Propionibacterium sp.]